MTYCNLVLQEKWMKRIIRNETNLKVPWWRLMFFCFKERVFRYLYNVWLYDKWSIVLFTNLAFWESNWEGKMEYPWKISSPWCQVTSFARELWFLLFSYAFFFLFTWLLMNEWSNMCKVFSKSLFSGCSLIFFWYIQPFASLSYIGRISPNP